MIHSLVLVVCLLFSSLSAAFDGSSSDLPESPLMAIDESLGASQEVLAKTEDAYVATDSYENAFIKMLAALGILLALLIVSFWAFRRLSRGRQGSWANGSSLRILEKRGLSQKSMLYVIEYEGKKILVAESQFEIRSLATLEDSASEHSAETSVTS